MADQLCKKPDCNGRIVDGYCEECGTDPASVAQTTMGAVTGSQPHVAHAARPDVRTIQTGRSAGLGLGIVPVPLQPFRDPSENLITNTVVPVGERYCSNPSCKFNAKPMFDPSVPEKALETGACMECGWQYDFAAVLQPGDLLDEQYRVHGGIAYGSFGWILEADDEHLKRVVVLKGLANAKDRLAQEVSMAERQRLAAFNHPNIVKVYAFVPEGAPIERRTDAGDRLDLQAPAGYIVMEYIGGRTLAAIREERGPLPVSEALAYALQILDALGHMHTTALDETNIGAAYCDLKPENVKVMLDRTVLIDLGSVRPLSEQGGTLFFSRGYVAPELYNPLLKDGQRDQPEMYSDALDPTVESDLFSVARLLAFLTMDFLHKGVHQFTMPPANEERMLWQNPAFHALLLKGMHPDPTRRFRNHVQMSQQVAAILHMVAGVPAQSVLFEGDLMGLNETNSTAGVHGPDASLLPLVRIDQDDPASGAILGTPDQLPPRPQSQTGYLEKVLRQFPDSPEAKFSLAFNYIQLGRFADADQLIATLDTSAQMARSDDEISQHQGKLDELRLAYDDCSRRAAMLGRDLERLRRTGNVDYHKSAELNVLDVHLQGMKEQIMPLSAQLKVERKERNRIVHDWRVAWYRGVCLARQNKFKEAQPYFNQVSDDLPGELAPLLARAMAAEATGDMAGAKALYQCVVDADPSFCTAIFGLARCHMHARDVDTARSTYALVLPTSATYLEAEKLSTQALIGSHHVALESELRLIASLKTNDSEKLRLVSGLVTSLATHNECIEAANLVTSLHIDEMEKLKSLSAIVQHTVQHLKGGSLSASISVRLLDSDFNKESLGTRLSAIYKRLADLTTDVEGKIQLIDQAHRARPRALLSWPPF